MFEMGTGVASSLLSPDFLMKVRTLKTEQCNFFLLETIGQAFDLLVSVS